jgi:hypothetical protein
LSSGYYTFKYIYDKSNLTIFEFDDVIFKIEPNSINYIGSLHIYEDKNSNRTGFSYKYIDDYDVNINILNSLFPEIKNMYAVKNNTPEPVGIMNQAKKY